MADETDGYVAHVVIKDSKAMDALHQLCLEWHHKQANSLYVDWEQSLYSYRKEREQAEPRPPNPATLTPRLEIASRAMQGMLAQHQSTETESVYLLIEPYWHVAREHEALVERSLQIADALLFRSFNRR